MKLDWQRVPGAERYTLAAGDYRIEKRELTWWLYFRGMIEKSYWSLAGAKIAAAYHAKRAEWRGY